MNITLKHKIVIIGAGPAGTSCAIALLNAGVSDVTIVSNTASKKFLIGESIPPNANQLLKQLGVYGPFLKENHDPCYGSCSYWGSHLRGYNDSILSPYGHGWHLDRKRFNELMLDQATSKGAKIESNCSFLRSDKKGSGFKMFFKKQFKEEIILDADIVVDASGYRSVFAQSQGSDKRNGTPLICLTARFKAKDDMECSRMTHLEAEELGWWYAARIPNNQMLVSFYTLPEIAKRRNLGSINSWLNRLKMTSSTHQLVSEMTLIDESILTYFAPTSQLDKVSGPNWLAIGDAASSYDPITSQGITKAIAHGIRAAESIVDLKETGDYTFQKFGQTLQNEFNQYEEARNYFYSIEQRWPGSVFWNRLQSTNKAASA